MPAAEKDRWLLVAESLREYVDATMWSTISEWFAAHDNPLPNDPLPLVIDRMPASARSAAGPNEGITTSDGDLAAMLEARRLEVIAHDWFRENPNWAVGVND